MPLDNNNIGGGGGGGLEDSGGGGVPRGMDFDARRFAPLPPSSVVSQPLLLQPPPLAGSPFDLFAGSGGPGFNFNIN